MSPRVATVMVTVMGVLSNMSGIVQYQIKANQTKTVNKR